MHLFFCYGMHELNLCRMKQHPAWPLIRKDSGWDAIQPVAYYRSVHPVRMCSMHANLMCPSGFWIEIYQ